MAPARILVLFDHSLLVIEERLLDLLYLLQPRVLCQGLLDLVYFLRVQLDTFQALVLLKKSQWNGHFIAPWRAIVIHFVTVPRVTLFDDLSGKVIPIIGLLLQAGACLCFTVDWWVRLELNGLVLLMAACAVRALRLTQAAEASLLLEILVVNYVEVRLRVVVHVLRLRECREAALATICRFNGVNELGNEGRDRVERDLLLVVPRRLLCAIDVGQLLLKSLLLRLLV